MAQKIDGPRIAAKSGKTRQLVVFLHGYGADGKDLIEIGRQWAQLLPDAAFVAPNAPEPCAMSPMGRQWFALSQRDPSERWAGVTKAQPALDAFLTDELAKHGLDERALALVGFSQGTMMALHTGLRRGRNLAGILGYSGLLVGPEHLPEVSARETPILLVHGDQDQVIPIDALFMASEELGKAGMNCQYHISVGIGHGIDGGGLQHGGQFLSQCFGVKIAG
ncbi:MAG: dienelactone hydrolase family protein [Hyphomicrobiales bacterium]|nr:dienelactone hydrolase family protein [Hyphomicrobiales bacterium]MDE2114365.1 dienelactone hydrolase family protein [Hyphomicrobiales bacterium]